MGQLVTGVNFNGNKSPTGDFTGPHHMGIEFKTAGGIFPNLSILHSMT